MRAYKVRKFKTGQTAGGSKEFYNFSLTIPVEIAQAIDTEAKYTCELIGEGALLFSPAIPEKPKTRRRPGSK